LPSRSVEVELKLTDKFSQTAKQAESGFKKLLGTFSQFKGLIGIGMGAGFTAFMKSTTEEMMAQQKADLALAEALRNVGIYSDETYTRLKDLAGALQLTTSYSDDTIQSIEALFSRFGIAPEMMEKAITTTMDYARATGKDLKSAALDMAKASEGNLMMLQRYGIRIDETAFKTRGFAAVLDGVREKFGGAEAAYANTFAGRLQQLKNMFGDLQEQIGGAIVYSETWNKVLDMLRGAILKVSEQISADQETWNEFMATIGEVVAKLIEGLPYVVEVVGTAFNYLWTIFKKIGESLGAISAAIFELFSGRFKNAVKIVEDWIGNLGTVEKTTVDIKKETNEVKKETNEVVKSTENAKNAARELATTYKVVMPSVRTEIQRGTDAYRDMEAVLKNIEEQTEETSRNIGWQMMQILDLQREMAYGFSSVLVDALFEADRNFTEILERWIIQLAEMILKEAIAAAILNAIGLGAYTGGTLGGAILSVIGFEKGGAVKGFRPLGVGGFREGGVITRPTLALVGEGGEKEYIIPESKIPQPQVFISVHNANPDTYVEVFTKWSPMGRQKFYREVIKRAQMETEI